MQSVGLEPEVDVVSAMSTKMARLNDGYEMRCVKELHGHVANSNYYNSDHA